MSSTDPGKRLTDWVFRKTSRPSAWGGTCFTKCILRVGKRAVVTRARAKGMGRRYQMDFKISIFGFLDQHIHVV
jgi:hypothetical protein